MSGSIQPVRGRIYMADLGHGQKPYVVVSNNARNRQLEDCLAVRITTSRKPDITSVVPLGPADPLVGGVLCDDLLPLFKDELRRDVGALTAATMAKVAVGLRYALAI